jgi:hypothetical protein
MFTFSDFENALRFLVTFHNYAYTIMPDYNCSRSDFNQDSFLLKKVLRRSHKSDTSTIRVVALSQDGTYLAAGFDSGLIEVRNHDRPLHRFLLMPVIARFAQPQVQ